MSLGGIGGKSRAKRMKEILFIFNDENNQEVCVPAETVEVNAPSKRDAMEWRIAHHPCLLGADILKEHGMKLIVDYKNRTAQLEFD